MKKEIIILSCDPGQVNFAYSFVSSTKGILAVGYLETLHSLTADNFPEGVKNFTKSFCDVLGSREVDYVVAERFQSRPGRGSGRKGVVGEYVNIMLGMMAHICLTSNVTFKLVVPGLWKKYMLNQYGTHDTEALLDKRYSVHECDAICIGVFSHEMYEDTPRGNLIPSILKKKIVTAVPKNKKARKSKPKPKSKKKSKKKKVAKKKSLTSEDILRTAVAELKKERRK